MRNGRQLWFGSVQFSPLTNWVIRGDMTDDLAEILFRSASSNLCDILAVPEVGLRLQQWQVALTV